MLPRISYLAWAVETFPTARWDLATSGITSISAEDLGIFETDTAKHLSSPSGRGAFVHAVSKRYAVSANEVIPALGTSGALWQVAAAILGGGAFEALVEQPTYEPLLRVFEGFGRPARRFARPLGEACAIGVDRVLRQLTPATRVVVVSNPHNPTGLVVADEILKDLAAALDTRGVWLVVDEVYRERVTPASTSRRLGPNVLAVSSLTKCFGLGWARAGWALVPPDLASACSVSELHAAGQLPTSGLAIGAHAFSRIDALAARADRLSEGKRKRVDAFLASHAGALAWAPPPPSALFGFVRARSFDVDIALQRARDRHGVIAVPGAHFDLPDGLRLSWANIPAADLGEALDLLADGLGLANAEPSP